MHARSLSHAAVAGPVTPREPEAAAAKARVLPPRPDVRKAGEAASGWLSNLTGKVKSIIGVLDWSDIAKRCAAYRCMLSRQNAQDI